MPVVVLGVVYRNCPLPVREKFAFSKSELASALKQLKRDFSQEEALILSTCNRVEVYAVPKDFSNARESLERFLALHGGLTAEEIRKFTFFYTEEEAVRHLFRVVCGLDSMVVGENEIVAQVKEAFREGQQAKAVQSLLYQLFERALRVSKKVRTETRINEGAVSVSSVAVELAEKIFGKLQGERVFIVGTGKMSELTLKHLQRAGAGAVWIASRHFERADALARKYSAEPVPFSEKLHYLKEADIVLSSTGAPHPILKRDEIQQVMAARKYRSLFLIDIAVPRDVEPDVNKTDGVYLYNIDDLRSIAESNARLRKKEIQKCEALIGEKVSEFMKWWRHLDMIPTIQKLQRRFDEAFDREIGELKKSRLNGLSVAEMEETLRRVKAKLLHDPLTVLKGLSSNGSAYHYLEVLERLFQLEDVKLDEDPNWESGE